MIRWRYLIPRLIILGLIGLILWLGTDPMMRWALIHGTQAITGAKVEIDAVESNLAKGYLRLSEVEIADPRDPMKNLFQADEAYLRLDPARLLHREFVIDSGRMRHIQFGTPRTESGALPGSSKTGEIASSWIPQGLRDQFRAMGEKFVDQFKSRALGQIEAEFETIQVSKQIRESWPAEIEKHINRIQAIRNRIDLVNKSIRETGSNPLRDIRRIPALLDSLESLNGELANARADFNRLEKRFQNDQRQLLAAKQRDMEKLGRLKSAASVDGDSISRLLLGEYQAAQVENVVSWIQWFRSVVPDPEKDFYPLRRQGVDVRFPGVQPHPKFLVKSIDLDGEGKVSGQHYHFSGQAFNLTTQPKLHDQPTTFELRAKGNTNVLVAASLDRRGPEKIDSVTVECPGIDVPGMTLGDKQVMLVDVSPGRLNAVVSMKINGDDVEGELEFQRSNVVLHVQNLHDVAGGQKMAFSLDRELADLNRFSAKVKIRGKLDNPIVEIQSDLGDRFALAMRNVMQQNAQKMIDQQLAKLENVYQQEVRQLDLYVGQRFRQVTNLLRSQSSVVSELKDLVPTIGDATKIR